MSPLAAAAMGSCDACGWAAAFMSMLGFGSFGAPIKSKAAESVDIDPLVFQTYKTFMFFITSWLVLAFGEPLTFTPWGIVSAFFWVPCGVAAIAGIKLAGLAVAMGTLASFIVLISFVWGIFVFDERIHSRGIASFAIFLMMIGLCGMSYYSSLEKEDDAQQQSTTGVNNNAASDDEAAGEAYRLLQDEEAAEQNSSDDNDNADDVGEAASNDGTNNDDDGDGVAREPLVAHQSGQTADDNNNLLGSPETTAQPNTNDVVVICGRAWPRRTVGIACSVFSGVWGGSIMAPEKMAKADTSGVGYLISFAIGAVIVTAALWLFRFSYHWIRLGSHAEAYQALPSFHVRVMWLPGCTAGALWSFGNFFSLISVKYLGEGAGYSVTQSAMLVSGLWGIFYFKEVTGVEAIMKWFLSASLTISGILLLSYEHHEK